MSPPFAEHAARWAGQYIYTSPWLFCKDDYGRFDLVDRVNIEFTNMDEVEISSFISEFDGRNPTSFVKNNAIQVDRNKYSRWEDLFEFQWHPLTLHLVREDANHAMAYFTDTKGRKSISMFSQVNDDLGVTSKHPDDLNDSKDSIPWFHFVV